MLMEDDERVYAFTRRLGDDELLVLGNFSGEDAAVEVENPGGGAALGNYEDPREPACCARGRRGCCGDDLHGVRTGAARSTQPATRRGRR